MLLFCWGTLGFRCQIRLKTLSPSSVSNQHPQGGKKPLGVSEFPRGRKGWPQREQPMSLRFLAKSKTINFESTVTAWIYAPGRFQVSSKTILQRRGKTTSFPIVVSQHERERESRIIRNQFESLLHLTCFLKHPVSSKYHRAQSQQRKASQRTRPLNERNKIQQYSPTCQGSQLTKDSSGQKK